MSSCTTAFQAVRLMAGISIRFLTGYPASTGVQITLDDDPTVWSHTGLGNHSIIVGRVLYEAGRAERKAIRHSTVVVRLLHAEKTPVQSWMAGFSKGPDRDHYS